MKQNSLQSNIIQICLEFETRGIVLPQCGRRLYSFTAAYPQGVVGDTLESPESSIFICGLWCLYACLCLLISLVCVRVYSPSCLIFPHSLSAFIIMKLPKQLQPSQLAVRDSCSSTHAVWFYHTHVLLCSASLQCIYLMWNWAEQWHDVKAVVWWARWRVESSPRWPLSARGWGGGGVEGLWRRNGLVSLWPDMLSKGNDIFSMVKTPQFQFISRGVGGSFFFSSFLELKVDTGVLLFC